MPYYIEKTKRQHLKLKLMISVLKFKDILKVFLAILYLDAAQAIHTLLSFKILSLVLLKSLFKLDI